MRDLRPSDRFQEPVQVLGGPRTRASIRRVGEDKQPNFEFSYEKIIARVMPDSLLATGQVIERIRTGDKYLVADHAKTPTYRVHRLLNVDRLVTWKRSTFTVDPLTNEQRSSPVPATLGQIWVLWDMIRREAPDFIMHTAEEKNLILTGEDIQLNDWLDDQQVKRVNRALGVNIVQVQ